MRRSALGLAIACASCAPGRTPAPSAHLSSPAPSAVAAPVTGTVLRVLVGGDVMPHRPALLDPARVANALAPLRPLFSAANAVVVNYETATGEPENLSDESKHIALAAPASWMRAVAGAKVTALSVANNHACDLGGTGLSATMREANADGLTSIGVDPRDPWRARVLAEEGGHRVCAVAWSTFTNAPLAGCADSGHIALADFKKRGLTRIDRAIERARSEVGCDAVIAIIHGGEEYEPQALGPLNQAKRAAMAGADAVVMHHPHVPSPVETVTTPDGRNVPIFESVGNLVSNQGESWKMPYHPIPKNRHAIALNAWTRLGILADLRWHWADGAPAGTRGTMEWGYELVWIDNEHAFNHAKLPRITVRLLDPVADRPLEDVMKMDEYGPITLFDDACRIEPGRPLCR